MNQAKYEFIPVASTKPGFSSTSFRQEMACCIPECTDSFVDAKRWIKTISGRGAPGIAIDLL